MWLKLSYFHVIDKEKIMCNSSTEREVVCNSDGEPIIIIQKNPPEPESLEGWQKLDIKFKEVKSFKSYLKLFFGI